MHEVGRFDRFVHVHSVERRTPRNLGAGCSGENTLILIEEDVLDAEMVSVEALIGGGGSVFGMGGGEAFLEMGEEDPGLHTGGRILEALQHGSECSVGGITRLLALLQELFHGKPHSSISLSLRLKQKQGRKSRGKVVLSLFPLPVKASSHTLPSQLYICFQCAQTKANGGQDGQKLKIDRRLPISGT